jgi:hypothetical protein
VDVDLDGEGCGSLPLSIKVAPKALKLFVPDFEPHLHLKTRVIGNKNPRQMVLESRAPSRNSHWLERESANEEII